MVGTKHVQPLLAKAKRIVQHHADHLDIQVKDDPRVLLRLLLCRLKAYLSRILCNGFALFCWQLPVRARNTCFPRSIPKRR